MLYELLPEFPTIPDYIIQIALDDFEKHRHRLVPTKDNFEKFKMLPEYKGKVDNEHENPDDLASQLGVFTHMAQGVYNKEICNFNTMSITSEVVMRWLEDNLPIQGIHAGLQEFVNGDFFPPHVDLVRYRAINFPIELGGSNVTTDFWKPKEEFAHLKITPRTAFPYERIEKIASYKIELHKWHQLDVTNIHSVENIEPGKRRMSFTLSRFNIPLTHRQPTK